MSDITVAIDETISTVYNKVMEMYCPVECTTNPSKMLVSQKQNSTYHNVW